ncbi:flagellar hook capping FlgD N-terminal domain-containing protein [Legionella rowbothamii]|uniref:flagellar hook capping FlgD N-terminal domain-containing protein n=1 Tax=Legionella rowbothamii TaxID=96229 RepID=UPI0010543DB3|nr:flagellar hook capping FlgD N-terminal domain-containing protein [Legionella rowbothamii]
MTEPVEAVNMGQDEYMKLFMQELTYQDPLKPIDNREFMAQMAQFSSLQQAVGTNSGVQQLLKLAEENRGLNLLGRKVKIDGQALSGEVKSVLLQQNGAIEIMVLVGGEHIKAKLDQVLEVEV